MGLQFQMQINNLPLNLACDSDGFVAICPTQKIVKNIIQDYEVEGKLCVVFKVDGFIVGGNTYMYNTLYKLGESSSLLSWLKQELLCFPQLHNF